MLLNHHILRSPDAAAAPAGGQSGAGTPAVAPLSPLHELAQMLSEESSPAAQENQDAPTSPAAGDPATAATTDTAAAPGQDNLTSDQKPPETPDGETPTGEPETDLPETENAELTQALAGLSPTERKSALELVKALQPGEIPRIAKLISQRNEAQQKAAESDALEKRIEELESQLAAGETGRMPVPLPAQVAKLKTIGEVKARQNLVRNAVATFQKFLMENSGDAKTVYDVQTEEAVNAEPDGTRYRTRADIVSEWQRYADELEALPVRAAELQEQHTQFTQARNQARAQRVKEFPELQDPEHPDTKLAQQLMKDPRFAGVVDADYAALALARGHRELQAEAAARKNGGHGKPLFGATGKLPVPPGKVPLGKPHAPAGSATPRVSEGPNVKAALDDYRKDGSRSSLAAVISASGL